MYTVLIIDKKKQMYHVYKNMLHWDKYNFEVISFADTMDDAFSYYREYRHDLIISDTELKDGNGIELFSQLKAYHPNCHMVFCSYDSSYETIRHAFRCGCMDYLIKDSLRNADIIDNMEWITQDYMRKYGVVNIAWNEELQRILGLIRDKQSFQIDELYHLLKREELKILTMPYRMLYFRMDDVKETFWHHRFEDRMQLNEQLKGVINTRMDTFPLQNVVLFSKMHAGILLIENCSQSTLLELANTLIHDMKATHDISMSVFISDECRGYEMFYESYVAYSENLSARFYMGNELIITMNQMPKFTSLASCNLSDRELILHQVDKRNFKEAISTLENMFKKIRSAQIIPEDVLVYCRSLINNIERQEIKRGIKKNQVLSDQCQNVFLRIETMDVLEMYMQQMLLDIINWITTSSKYLYSDIVVDIMQYVNEHIQEKITLQDIANAIHRTPIHISRVFKKQMKENLMSYINRCKMEKAALMLNEHSTMKIKDIAEYVGMDDQLYFNKVFRKYYHVSPREYRKE